MPRILVKAALSLAVALPGAAGTGAARTPEGALSATEQALVSWIDRNQDQALAFLGRIVDVESGTTNAAGVREVGRIFEEELRALGFASRWVAMPPAMRRAGHLLAERLGPAGRGRRILLVGHLDTVVEGHRFRRDGARAWGNGIEDMKGGDAVILYALKALHAAGLLEGATVRVAFMGDEESPGRPTAVSRLALVEAARQSDVALCFEADAGKATIARRGMVTWTLRVTGVQGHSAGILDPDTGAGAIYEAARIVEGFRAVVAGQRAVTLNPALVVGGTDVSHDPAAAAGTAAGRSNVVARSAVVTGDYRFLTPAQKAEVEAAMRRVAAASLPRASAELTFEEGFPSMPPTPGNLAVLTVVDGATRALGQGPSEPLDPLERGAGDFSFIAADVSGVDGLGVAGDGAHGPEEWMEVASLAASTKRAALVMARLLRAAP